jgi:hypothetical protein
VAQPAHARLAPYRFGASRESAAASRVARAGLFLDEGIDEAR